MKKERIIARIGEDEKKEITDFCKKNHISISDFIRELIRKKEQENIRIITNKEKEILYNLNYEFQKIGININQIAHYFNLEHLKNLSKNSKNFEDLVLLDKVKKEQLEEIKNLLSEVEIKLRKTANFLKKQYGS